MAEAEETLSAEPNSDVACRGSRYSQQMRYSVFLVSVICNGVEQLGCSIAHAQLFQVFHATALQRVIAFILTKQEKPA